MVVVKWKIFCATNSTPHSVFTFLVGKLHDFWVKDPVAKGGSQTKIVIDYRLSVLKMNDQINELINKTLSPQKRNGAEIYSKDRQNLAVGGFWDFLGKFLGPLTSLRAEFVWSVRSQKTYNLWQFVLLIYYLTFAKNLEKYKIIKIILSQTQWLSYGAVGSALISPSLV